MSSSSAQQSSSLNGRPRVVVVSDSRKVEHTAPVLSSSSSPSTRRLLCVEGGTRLCVSLAAVRGPPRGHRHSYRALLPHVGFVVVVPTQARLTHVRAPSPPSWSSSSRRPSFRRSPPPHHQMRHGFLRRTYLDLFYWQARLLGNGVRRTPSIDRLPLLRRACKASSAFFNTCI